jgi:hypothetical protein
MILTGDLGAFNPAQHAGKDGWRDALEFHLASVAARRIPAPVTMHVTSLAVGFNPAHEWPSASSATASKQLRAGD